MPLLETLQQRIAERPWRAGLYACAAIMMLALTLASVDYLLRPQSIPVRNASFEGAFRNVGQQELADAVMEGLRGNFLLLDLDAIQARARSVPWVHDVTVRRRWPDGVHIRFSEQELAARWGMRGWVNAQGELVTLHGRPGPDGLPTLAGPEGTQARVLEHYRRLSEILVPAGLQITTLTLTPRHSWNIVLTNGLQLTLGREAPEQKVMRFANVYIESLASQAGRIKRIDLRYTNGFAIEWGSRAERPRASEIIKTGLSEG